MSLSNRLCSGIKQDGWWLIRWRSMIRLWSNEERWCLTYWESIRFLVRLHHELINMLKDINTMVEVDKKMKMMWETRRRTLSIDENQIEEIEDARYEGKMMKCKWSSATMDHAVGKGEWRLCRNGPCDYIWNYGLSTPIILNMKNEMPKVKKMWFIDDQEGHWSRWRYNLFGTIWLLSCRRIFPMVKCHWCWQPLK